MSFDSSNAVAEGFDPDYEITRATDADALYRKVLIKRRLQPFIGEPYIGRRAKMAHFKRWLRRLALPDRPGILEVGSGEGSFCFAAADMMPDATVIGVEINEAEQRACQRLAEREKRPNLKFCAANLSSSDYQARFDLVVCLDVLEHVRDHTAFAQAMGACLAEGGRLLAHVPSRFYKTVDGELKTVPDDEAWRINPGHVRQGYTPDELGNLLRIAGFGKVEVVPASGRPIAKAYRLFERTEHSRLARVAVMPVLDHWIRQDLKSVPEHGNTLWAIASSFEKPS